MTQKDRIISYFEIRVTAEVDADLLSYAVDELLSRAKLYLNMTEIPEAFEMALVNVLVSQMSQYEKELSGKDSSELISKIEDNGQSIWYGEKMLNFFATQPDNVVFASACGVLSRYRLAKVIVPEDYDDEDT
jgi:hypothetical protein